MFVMRGREVDDESRRPFRYLSASKLVEVMSFGRLEFSCEVH